MIDYKKDIIKMLKKLDDERFIRYLHTLISEMIAKSFGNKHGE